MSSTPSNPEYVLGTGRDELERLGFQHQLWSDSAHALWKLARIGPGYQVLDVGCGPGYAAMDMAGLVGIDARGSVLGIDESAGYIGWLNEQARVRGLSCSGVVGDVQDVPGVLSRAEPKWRPGSFDLAYARWVLCFVPDPLAVVRGVASALRPGGRFCVQDYFNYRAMTMAPRRPAHDKAVAATVASWHARGGDTDIMGKLPALLASAGFRVDHIGVNQRVARGTDTMFHWGAVWWRIFAPKLVEMGRLSQADCDQLVKDIDEVAASETSFWVPPALYDIVATKL